MKTKISKTYNIRNYKKAPPARTRRSVGSEQFETPRVAWEERQDRWADEGSWQRQGRWAEEAEHEPAWQRQGRWWDTAQEAG